MSGTEREMLAALEAARRAQADLDRRNYHLRSLFEVTQELSGILVPQKILETFLLLSLGPLGCAHGAALFCREDQEPVMAAWRGLEEGEALALRRSLRATGPESAAAEQPRALLLTGQSEDFRRIFPPGLEAAVFWSQDGQYQGLLTVGGKISGEPLDQQDLDTLLTLVNVLIASLRHALSTAGIRQLNAELTRRNEELHQALDQARRVQGLLAHQIFHLKGMNDLADELSILGDTGTLLHVFLLHELGLFTVDKGFLLLADRGNRTATPLGRGFSLPDLDFTAWDRLLQACFDAVELRALTPMSVTRLHDPGRIFAAVGLPPGLTTAFFFVIEPTWLGVLALSDKLDGRALNRDERALLSAQTASLMAFVKNTRALETARTLNESLERRVRELQAAVEKKTVSRRAGAFLAHLRGLASGKTGEE